METLGPDNKTDRYLLVTVSWLLAHLLFIENSEPLVHTIQLFRQLFSLFAS